MAQKKEMSGTERRVIEAIVDDNLSEVQALLLEPGLGVDFLDDTGMTPLQHAAFRARREICRFLLASGSDVNSNYHDNGYTALMFAALSGNVEVTRMMLDAGANPDHTNSVGRTAAQMAAFVGQHQCVAAINNFFPSSGLDIYTKPQGLEKEPRLPQHLAPVLVKMINMSNMNPVRIAYFLQDHKEILENSKKVSRVFDTLCEKAMKARDTSDIMALKTHYFATIIRRASKVYEEKQNLDGWIKSLVRGRESDGFPELQDKLIKQSLKEFPYPESELLQQMVHNLANPRLGTHPSAVVLLSQAINGQRYGANEEEDCTTCGQMRAEKKCSACKMVRYCDAYCQKLHWSTHKMFCKDLAVKHQKIQEQKQREHDEEAKHLAEIEAQKRQGEDEELNQKMEDTHIKDKNDAETSTLNGESEAEWNRKVVQDASQLQSLTQATVET
ncbi:hypothetical protein CHS0354_030220 [Potamilus streckersoni]|uniref:MYND-type domain-containing protein n=1 Tax=Potamilus streckersoni TaxID=2493646 RepID=A0AAE0RSH0_9BIVA|nr:hypothetical protein CHS0354_030220 [Potamilus streckersoni]